MTGLLICAALGIEAHAIRRGLPAHLTDVRVVATGIGPRRAARAAERLHGQRAVAVVGFGGAVAASLRPGDVLVADEIRYRGRVHPCPWAALLAEELDRAGLPARVGPLLTVDHLVRGAERRRLAGQGVQAVDMESGPLARAAADRPLAAVRVIVDAPQAPLLRPATLARGLAARRTLAAVGPVLVRWAAAAGPCRTIAQESVPFPLLKEPLT
ncbi:phosphorylase family protein [Nonomuraea wenchangensis]|uniref:phosphorylase family protein n=1 Tax=Nonomuraea wenchangensis TaxID=568860 RepID=UPI0033F565A5